MTGDLREIDEILRRALSEDIGSGDVTTLATVPASRLATARFVAKEAGVVAGLRVTERVFALLDPAVEVRFSVEDGSAVEKNASFGQVAGSAQAILSGERLALNILQRMSGIATASRAFADAARPAIVLDTRKTAPGLRVLDKWAVRLGGAQNHRAGLYDMILIKDNHITAAGGVRQAVEAALSFHRKQGGDVPIEVEARTVDEVHEILSLRGVDRIMLDNMVRVNDDGLVDVSLLNEAVQIIGGRIETEASGNVTMDTVAAIAATGVTYVSVGALTHSVRALDISLKIDVG
jgi:nicotinate-nucleotide pyrophosphorylase (carboxylating)